MIARHCVNCFKWNNVKKVVFVCTMYTDYELRADPKLIVLKTIFSFELNDPLILVINVKVVHQNFLVCRMISVWKISLESDAVSRISIAMQKCCQKYDWYHCFYIFLPFVSHSIELKDLKLYNKIRWITNQKNKLRVHSLRLCSSWILFRSNNFHLVI